MLPTKINHLFTAQANPLCHARRGVGPTVSQAHALCCLTLRCRVLCEGCVWHCAPLGVTVALGVVAEVSLTSGVEEQAVEVQSRRAAFFNGVGILAITFRTTSSVSALPIAGAAGASTGPHWGDDGVLT